MAFKKEEKKEELKQEEKQVENKQPNAKTSQRPGVSGAKQTDMPEVRK